MDRRIQIHNLTCFYQEAGSGKQAFILLHGWAQTHVFWATFIKRFSDQYNFYALDLPGFGLSQEPNSPWTIIDYAHFLNMFVKKLEIKNPIIAGHSFGGKIACAYAALYPVKKSIIYSASLSPTRSIIKRVHKQLVSVGKHLFPNQLYRLHGRLFKPGTYKNKHIVSKKRSKLMLTIYTNTIVNPEALCSKISTDTLVITGENDYIVPPKESRHLASQIQKALFVVVSNATHFAHIENPKSFYKTVEEFLKH